MRFGKNSITSALNEINKARKYIKLNKESDAIWLFNRAFLNAYRGKLDKAHKDYFSAEKGDYSNKTIIEIEVFILNVLEEEPNKFQLWYCLGILNYIYKKDYQLAYEFFSNFIKHDDACKVYPNRYSYAEQTLPILKNNLTNHANES